MVLPTAVQKAACTISAAFAVGDVTGSRRSLPQRSSDGLGDHIEDVSAPRRELEAANLNSLLSSAKMSINAESPIRPPCVQQAAAAAAGAAILT